MRRIPALLLVLCLMVGLFGCTPDEGPTSAVPTPAQSPADAPSADGFGLPYTDEGVFDPLTTESALNLALTPLICQSLFVRGADMSLTPELCAELSHGDGQVTVTLRGDCVFHGGSTLFADDVVYSFERIKKSKYSPYADMVKDIASAKAVADDRVVFRSEDGGHISAASLCFPVIRNGTGRTEDADGTGSYALRSSGGERYLSAVGGDAALSELPYSRMELVAVSDMEDLVTAFETGRVDCMALDALSVRSFMPICTYSVQSAPTGRATVLEFNCTDRRLTATVRAAISALLDREALCGRLLSGSLSPSPHFTAGEEVACGELLTEAPARQALASEGISAEAPLEVRLLYCSDVWQRQQQAEQLAAMLAPYGIAVTPDGRTAAEYEKARREGKFDLCLARVFLRDGEDLFALLSTEGEENCSGYGNADADAELRVLMTVQSDTAQEAASRLSQLLTADMPVAVIGYESLKVYFRDGRISAFAPTPDRPYGDPADWELCN